MRASAVGTSDVRVHPAAAASATASASKRSCTVRGVPVARARVTTERPPTWASGRQASQRSPAGIDAQPLAGGQGRRRHRGVGEHDGLRRAGGAAGGHHQRIAGLHGGRRVARRRPAPRRSGRAREPRVDGQHRVAVVPCPPKRIDERPRRPASRHDAAGAQWQRRTGSGRLAPHGRPSDPCRRADRMAFLARRRPAPHPPRRHRAGAGGHRLCGGRALDHRLAGRRRRPRGPPAPDRHQLRQRLQRRRPRHRCAHAAGGARCASWGGASSPPGRSSALPSCASPGRGWPGIALAAAVGPQLLVVGAAAIAAGWFYTGGSHPYGYYGFGELFVFVFFGLVATIGSAYVQHEQLTALALVAAVPVGLLATALLVINNLRDIPGDTESGKRTLAVRLGDRRTRVLRRPAGDRVPRSSRGCRRVRPAHRGAGPGHHRAGPATGPARPPGAHGAAT